MLDPVDWEPVQYSKGDDTCTLCGEEVEDADELRGHLVNKHGSF
jgi:hypothetical protein